MVDRAFTDSDQENFAAWTGDRNPLHMDPVWASRVYPGAIVVHGMHVVLWMLESCLPQSTGLCRLEVKFQRPVLLGDVVRAIIVHRHGSATISASVLGKPVVQIDVVFESKTATGSTVPSTIRPLRGRPRTRELESMHGLSGYVGTPIVDLLSREFPRTSTALGAETLGGLASLSTLVGMECPGLRSVFAHFWVDFEGTDCPLQYRVTNVDHRFSRVTMNVLGCGLTGEVVASTLPSDDGDFSSLPAVVGRVKPNEFSESTPLVLGSSSGLGAVTAVLLAAGGAKPVLAARGLTSNIERVRDWIASLGATCSLIHFDVTKNHEGLKALNELQWTGCDVFYFPSPRIFRRRLQAFQIADWTEFEQVYVQGFASLIHGLMTASSRRPLRVFFPSSVYVESMPDDLIEYALAKQTGEGVCRALEREYRNLRISVERLPRIHTRQTKSFLPVESANASEVMLARLRNFYSDC